MRATLDPAGFQSHGHHVARSFRKEQGKCRQVLRRDHDELVTTLSDCNDAGIELVQVQINIFYVSTH